MQKLFKCLTELKSPEKCLILAKMISHVINYSSMVKNSVRLETELSFIYTLFNKVFEKITRDSEINQS